LDTLPDFVESQLSLFSDKRLVPADWQRTNLATTICEAPHLDFVGVDLYAPLAAAAEADAAGASADWTSIAIVQAEWTAALHTVCVFSRGFGEVAVG
jgi:D-serine deaminase-like pyridoxal phosphate-dependent protein